MEKYMGVLYRFSHEMYYKNYAQFMKEEFPQIANK